MTLVKRKPDAPDPLLGVFPWLPLYPEQKPKSWQWPTRSCHLYPYHSDPSSYSSTHSTSFLLLDLKSPRHLSIHDLYTYHLLYLGCTADTGYHAPPHPPGLYSFFFWQGEGFLIALCKCVTECKFECPMYGEVKQIETSEFGAERGLLQGQSRRMGGLCSKIPNSLKSFSKAFLKRRWGRGIPGFITSPCTSLWLVDDDQSLGSRSLGARCSWPLSKNFFHFLQKNSGICIRYYLGGASLVAQL